MRIIKGIPDNINKTIIGRIQKKHAPLFNHGESIFTGNISIPKKGYKATISTNQLSNTTGRATVSMVNSTRLLETDDIVSVDQDGIIRQLYSVNSIHNSIFLTELCNSRCIFCPQPPSEKEDDKTALNLEIIKLIRKAPESIGITGGEPTLLEDSLFKVLVAIQKKFPKTKIYILSNGIKFANYEFTKRFANECSNNVMVELPLYSDYSKIHNKIVGTKTFYKTQEGIYNLAKNGIKIGLRNVISQINYTGLENYAEYIYRNFPFASQVAFMQMELEGIAKRNIDDVWIDPQEYSKELQRAIKHLYLRGVNALIFNFQLCLLDSFYRQFAVKSITEWKQNYLPICNECTLKMECPGFFKSTVSTPSQGISPITIC